MRSPFHTGHFLPFVGALIAVQPASADVIAERHGAVSDGKQEMAVEGGITAVLQKASDDRASDAFSTSFDLVSTIPAGPGIWTVYVEGSTSQRGGSVSGLFPESNADAGTALDPSGKGRFQVSEFHYEVPVPGGAAALGLVDVTSYLDVSDVANDETRQFLGATLVNNPTIGFPDYTVGAIYHHEAQDDLGYTVVLTSSHGLADNPNASYSEVFDLGADGKGVFAAAEFYRQFSALNLRAGVWTNTADAPLLDGSAGTDSNYGIYAVSDWRLGAGQGNVRIGLANEEVSQAAKFVSLALEHPVGAAALGAGVSWTGVSGEDPTPDLDDLVQAEVYGRFEVKNYLHVTPSVQWLSNSGFDSSETSRDADAVIVNLRASYTF